MPKQAKAKTTEISTALSELPDDLLEEVLCYISTDVWPILRLIDQRFNAVVMANLFPRLSRELQTQWLVNSLTLDNSRLPTKTIKTILSNLQQTHYLLPERFTILLALAKQLDIKVTPSEKIIEKIIEQIHPENDLSGTILFLSIFLTPKPDSAQCYHLLTAFIEALELKLNWWSLGWDMGPECISPLIPLQSLILALEDEQCDNLLARAKEILINKGANKSEIASFTLAALIPRLDAKQLNGLFNLVPKCIDSCYSSTGLNEALTALIPRLTHTQHADLLNSLIQKEEGTSRPNQTLAVAIAYTLEAFIPTLDAAQALKYSTKIIENLLNGEAHVRHSARRTLNALAMKLSDNECSSLLTQGFTILQDTFWVLKRRNHTYGYDIEPLDAALKMLLATHLLVRDTDLVKNLLTEQVEKLKSYKGNAARVLIAFIPHLNTELSTYLLTQLTAICDNYGAKEVIKTLQKSSSYKIARPSCTTMDTNNIIFDREPLDLLPIFIKKLTGEETNYGAELEQLILKLEASQCTPLINTLVPMLGTSSASIAAHFLGFLIVTRKCDIKTLNTMPEIKNSFLGEIIYQMADFFDKIQSQLATPPRTHSFGFFNHPQEMSKSCLPEATVAVIKPS